jgi:hypothetical protein
VSKAWSSVFLSHRPWSSWEITWNQDFSQQFVQEFRDFKWFRCTSTSRAEEQLLVSCSSRCLRTYQTEPHLACNLSDWGLISNQIYHRLCKHAFKRNLYFGQFVWFRDPSSWHEIQVCLWTFKVARIFRLVNTPSRLVFKGWWEQEPSKPDFQPKGKVKPHQRWKTR